MRLSCLCFLVMSFCLLSGCGGASPTTPVDTSPAMKIETKKKGTNVIKEELPQ